jgi:hypothetical protein
MCTHSRGRLRLTSDSIGNTDNASNQASPINHLSLYSLCGAKNCENPVPQGVNLGEVQDTRTLVQEDPYHGPVVGNLDNGGHERRKTQGEFH